MDCRREKFSVLVLCEETPGWHMEQTEQVLNRVR